MDAAAFLDYLRGRPFYKDQIVYVRQIPPRQAIHGRLHSSIHPDLLRCLERGGLWPLYIHQAEAIDALAEGEHVAVSTPAASGKSLCYNLPVLNALLADRGSRAMYVYPTKALAQDQLKGLPGGGRGAGIPGRHLRRRHPGTRPACDQAVDPGTAHQPGTCSTWESSPTTTPGRGS